MPHGVALYVGAVLLVLPSLAAKPAGPASLISKRGKRGVSIPVNPRGLRTSRHHPALMGKRYAHRDKGRGAAAPILAVQRR
ncbi:hypothetical protein DL991_29085 [Amycolatopsis sp. WAC 01375]|nr:hypothetical protein DL991_29085 [Amycolatopsis sp. WAC 01375]